MKSYILNIQILESKPKIWRRIEISEEFTFTQLHQIICLAMGWDDKKTYHFQTEHFSTSHQTSIRNQSIAYYFDTYHNIRYTYGDQEVWELAIDVEASQMVYEETLQLLSFQGNHPPYGLGGLKMYQNMLDEIQNPDSIHYHTIHMILEAMRPAFDTLTIQTSFDEFLNRMEDIEATFAKQLRHCRNAFEKAKMIAPNLIMLKVNGKAIPCYLDQLDNGMELMIFPNESCFVRSIMNAMNEDPDLLFTDAWTIDFLYETYENSDLYLSDGKNLCFRNRPGRLAEAIQEVDMIFLLTCLKRITKVLEKEHIPTLADQQMGSYENDKYTILPFSIQEKTYALSLTKQDLKTLHKFPHTNEHISLYMIALPNADSEFSKKLHIRFIAQSLHDYKEMDICLDSMALITDQLYPFLMDLFQEHGIPEAFQLNNINLAHILSEICSMLKIECIVRKPQCDYSEATVEMIVQAMEAATPVYDDGHTNRNQKDSIHTFFDEMYSQPHTAKQKILN